MKERGPTNLFSCVYKMHGRLSHATGQRHQQSQHFILHLSHVFPVYTIALHGPFYPLHPAPPAISFPFLVEERPLRRKKHALSLSVRCTEYALASRKQPSRVDMRTVGCRLDIEFSALAFSQTPASIKLQTSLFWNFSALFQIIKAVIAVLTHPMGCIYCWDQKLKHLQVQ